MKKLMSLLLVLVLSVSLFSACSESEPAEEAAGTTTTEAPAEKFVVGYSNLADTDVFCMVRANNLKDLTADIPNLEMIFTDANNDISKQLDQMDNFIVQEVDAIVVVPVDYDGIVPGVEKANAAGIPVIALGIQSNGGDTCYIGSTNIDAGIMQAEYFAEFLGEGAEILYLEGQSGLYHSAERKAGFLDTLMEKRPDVTVLATLDGKYDRAEGMKITEDWVQQFTKFDAVIAANDQMGLGAIEALKVSNRLEGVAIAGVDAVPDALAAIEAGEMTLSIFQNGDAQAENCKMVILELMDGKALRDDIIIPFEVVDAANVAEYQ